MSGQVSVLPSAPLRLAAVQAEAVSGDVPGNARRAAEWAARAAERGAAVVVFPELHLCGYDLSALAAGGTGWVPAGAGGRVADPRLDPLAEAAAEHAVTVLAGAAVRRGDGLSTNSVLCFRPSGPVTVAYDKQHLWQAEERGLFSPGSGTTVLAVGEWHLGLGICYDASFPEHGRAAALAGAHAYLCSGAFAAGSEYRAAIYLAARALENTVYAVFANPVGGPPYRPCGGGTAVYGPRGGEVCRVDTAREALLLADLDPREIEEARALLPLWRPCRAHPAVSHTVLPRSSCRAPPYRCGTERARCPPDIAWEAWAVMR